MFSPPIIAHGALGPFDEVILLSIAAIFFVMMGISWFRNRGSIPDPDPLDAPELPPIENPNDDDAPSRFTLE